MLKKTIKIVIGIEILAVILVAGVFWKLGHPRVPQIVPSCPVSLHPTQGVVRPVLMPKKPLLSHEVAALKRLFESCIQAYSNRDSRTFAKLSKQISMDRVRRLGEADFRSLDRDLGTIFSREFFCENEVGNGSRHLPEFPDEINFRSYIEVIFELVKLRGELYCQRGIYERAGMFEEMAFYHLRMFKKKFAHENNQKLSDCTERLIATWIEQIESENGLCRRCLHGVWQRNLPHVESGEVKREDMLKFVRNVSAFALERMCDYVPKWINEIQ